MNKHTRGPWTVGPDATVYGQRLSVDGSNRVIGTFELADCKGYKAEREANAQLVAAAPELLEACKGFVEWWENWTTSEDPCSVNDPNIPTKLIERLES